MSKYVRKTKDVYLIMGFYDKDWEEVCEEETRTAAREQVKCYNENEPDYMHCWVKKRVKIQEGE